MNSDDITRLARAKSIEHYKPETSRGYKAARYFFAWLFFVLAVIFAVGAILGVFHV